MQTSGLLIHLAAGTPPDATPGELMARDDLVLGERADHLWPAVLEAPTGRASVDAVRSLERLSCVGRVDVVFIGTDEEGE